MLALGWLFIFAACVAQGCRFYLQTSILTYQKALFACMAAHALGRALWGTLADETASATSLSSLLGQLGPSVALFLSAYCALLLNWAQIFQMHFEKKDFQRLFRSSDGSLWFQSTVRAVNAVAWGSLLYEGWRRNAASGSSAPYFGGLMAGFGCIAVWGFLLLSTQKRFAIDSLTSHSTKLHKISVLVVLVTASILGYFVLWFVGFVLDFRDIQGFLPVWELAHVCLHLLWLRNSDMSVLPLPHRTKALTEKWLTSMLQEHGTIPGNIKVKDFTGGSRPKGCHFQVTRVSINYNHEVTETTPRTFIVKILSWDKSILQRMELQFRRLFDFDCIESQYLKSYQIEHRFYKHVAPRISGLKLPVIFYNFEDCFNNQFGMVLEDLSSLEDGQPHGFDFEECCICLRRLAQFHANNWNRKLYSSKVKKWTIGGYWTGHKREANKRLVRESWQATKKNFATEIPELSSDRFADLGERLEVQLDFIMNKFEDMQPFTLVHGDFKLSNLFLGREKNLKRPEPVPPAKHFTSGSAAATRDIPEDDGTKLYAIDWQWLGLGSCAIDVFYFIVSSTDVSVLARQADLMDVYHAELSRHLRNESMYPFESFERDLEICFVDFCSYVIVSKWGKMVDGKANLDRYQRKRKDGMHLRTLDHIRHIVDYTDRYLVKLESDKKTD